MQPLRACPGAPACDHGWGGVLSKSPSFNWGHGAVAGYADACRKAIALVRPLCCPWDDHYRRLRSTHGPANGAGGTQLSHTRQKVYGSGDTEVRALDDSSA